MNKFFPFLEWLPLAKKYWKDDLIAGITGTIISIPQSVAFAMIAGMPPIYGFYSAVIIPIIAGLFGSSFHMISGPTTAISMIVFASISKFAEPTTMAFVELTFILTIMVGLIQLAMGILKMGKLVDFVSHSVIIGFTAGAGILIAFKQMKHVFGINMPTGVKFYEIIYNLINQIGETNLYVFAVAMSTFFIALGIKFFIKPISKFYMLFAMIAGSFIAYFMGGEIHGIHTVGNINPNFSNIFNIPNFSFENIKLLTSSAFVLAIFGLVEAVAIGKSLALTSHQKIDNNSEFIGQGLSNFIGGFLHSFVSSGSFTRSGVNQQAGAKTPMAGIFAAFGLLLVLLFGAKYASFLPIPALGGVILIVGYNLIDFHHIKTIFKSSKKETIVFLVTFFGTLFIDLQYALLAGVLVSLFFYLERTSNINIALIGLNKENKFTNIIRDKNVKVCPQIEIIRIDGSIYFGALDKLTNFFSNLYQDNHKNIIIVAQGINFIDLAGAEWLTHQVEKFKEKGGHVFIVGIKLVSRDILLKGGFIDKIGTASFYSRKTEAIADMYKALDKEICNSCELKVFKECKSL